MSPTNWTAKEGAAHLGLGDCRPAKKFRIRSLQWVPCRVRALGALGAIQFAPSPTTEPQSTSHLSAAGPLSEAQKLFRGSAQLANPGSSPNPLGLGPTHSRDLTVSRLTWNCQTVLTTPSQHQTRNIQRAQGNHSPALDPLTLLAELPLDGCILVVGLCAIQHHTTSLL